MVNSSVKYNGRTQGETEELLNDFHRTIKDVAHGFNNLLLGIIGNVKYLDHEKLVKPEGQRSLQEILSCAERSNKLTELLLQKTDHLDKPDGELPWQVENFSSSQETSDRSQYKPSKFLHDTILLVDDEEVVRNVTTAMLERAGYRVISTGSGKEALEIFQNCAERIHCVLLDLTMPYIRGNLVFARMKAIYPDVNVFLMSGYSTRQVMQEFENENIKGFLQKPFSADVLLNAVKSVKTESNLSAQPKGDSNSGIRR